MVSHDDRDAESRIPREDDGEGRFDRRDPGLDGQGDDPPETDVLFDVLASPRRRRVLYFLVEARRSSTLRAIAEILATFEQTTTERSRHVTSDRVAASLYHAHLPKLDAHGFLEFDPATGTVTASDRLDSLEAPLDSVARLEPDEYDRFVEHIE